ncbi:MAG: MG2 domain-containing protein [Armatimonadetes bacterium]|nr:MG2 domain-containing protein [Armatimonadota bacterium]
MKRDVWLAFLILVWFVGGLIALIRSEMPRGRVLGKTVAAETGQVLPNATIWFEHPKGSWKVVSKKDGSFELPNLPAGTYTVTASTYAHNLEPVEFTLKEGETRNLIVALEPVKPFLELIHPQTVFHPDENVKVGIRGFVTADELKLQVWQVELNPEVPLTTLLQFLSEVRQGWWQGIHELKDVLWRIQPCLRKVSEKNVAISQRDAEGVFMQFLPVNLPSEGIFLVRISADGLERIALVELTKVGLVLKVGRNKNDEPVAMAYAADLKTGSPIEGIEVQCWVRERKLGKEIDKKIAASKTNSDGLTYLPISQLNLDSAETCFFVAFANQFEKPLPVAWVSVWNYDLSYAVASPQVIFGSIYTDRPVYRPGNKVHFKGIVRFQSIKGYSVPKPSPFLVTVRDPDDNLVYRTTLPLTNFGSFSGSFSLNEEAATGTYRIEASQQNGSEGFNRIVGEFVVAAYRKPEVQVTVKPVRSRFSRSDEVAINVAARYYFGLPVANAEVSYWVTRLPIVDDFETGEWGESYGGETILEGETKTDADGRATIRFRPESLPTEAPPFTEFRYEVYLTVRATGYQFAEGTTSFLVTQGDWKLTIWCEPSFVAEGKEVKAKAKLVHWDTKKPQPNALVRWRAGVTEWHGKEVSIRWKLNGESKTDAEGETEWNFVPDEIGDWVIEAVVYDEKKNAIGSETSLLVVTTTRAQPTPLKLPTLQIWLDKKRYQIGDVANVAVRSKLKEATVLLTVEGERIHLVRLLKLVNGNAQISIPLSTELMPNAYISASLVWQKKFAQQVEPLRFETENFRLQVSVKSDKNFYEPREGAKISLQVRNSKGEPVKAEVSIAVVDDAIYAIREDDPESIFRAFYSERPNKVVTQYSFPWLAWQGDKGETESVRKFFPDTALWLPHVVTDENGTAQVELKIPDTLTQWRITAVAHTTDTSIGYGVNKFRCSKPFGVRLSAPIVLTQGDQTTISAIVHNDGEQICHADVVIEAEHESLEKMSHRKSVSVRPRKTATVSWDFKAERSGRWLITVRAKSSDGRTDAEQRSITVLPHAIEQTFARTIFLSPEETERTLKIVLPPNAELQASQIYARVAPSVFSAVLGALEYLATYPYGCVEQTMNSLLPNLMVWKVVKQKNIKVGWLEKELPKMVQRCLMRLYRFQHEDGGWGWWEDDPTNLWMTALVVRGLAEAKRAGFEVNERVLKKGIKALERMVQKNWRYEDADSVAFALFALARSEAKPPSLKVPTTYTPVAITNPQSLSAGIQFPIAVAQSQISGRQSLITSPQSLIPDALVKRCSPYGLAFLTLALHEWRHNEAKKVAERLLRTSMPLREELTWDLPSSSQMATWTTTEEITAWALLALMKVEAINRETAIATVRSILQNRKGVGWVSTKDTAAILETLLEFARRYEVSPATSPIKLSISLNGSIHSAQLTQDAFLQPEATFRLTGKLVAGTNEVKIVKSGQGSAWLTLVSKQVLVLPERLGELMAGDRKLQRFYEKLTPSVSDTGEFEWKAKPLKEGDSVKVGELIRVTLKVNCPTSFMVLEDPIPAGMRVVEAERMGYESRQNGLKPKEIYDDKTVTFFRQSGRYEVQYLLRVELPGDYHILPPRLWHMYGQERWNGAEGRLRVLP